MTKAKTVRTDSIAEAPPEDTTSQQDELTKSQKVEHWPFDNGNFAPLHSLRREVDDIFNQFTTRFGTLSRQSSDEFQLPVLDVDETESAFEIAVELPGVAKEDIDVSITDSVLTIHGEKQSRSESEDANRRIAECSYGVFERSLALPFNCDAKTIDANYDNGVLQLKIPKPKQVASKAQKVAIKSTA